MNSRPPTGRTHGAPHRDYGYVPLRFGGTSLGEWEHNNNICTISTFRILYTSCVLVLIMSALCVACNKTVSGRKHVVSYDMFATAGSIVCAGRVKLLLFYLAFSVFRVYAI